ncbi:hypothetical protein [Undibacterium sp. TJN19]|uniref:hypothetical protein n=1 Tax=Undibacterium sp. TJN19 TaxID=3413055 RepID=UPI003BF2651A
MLISKQFVVLAGVASLLLTSFLGKKKQQEKHLEKKLHKIELTTWEGEGGNLPVSAGKSAATEH